MRGVRKILWLYGCAAGIALCLVLCCGAWLWQKFLISDLNLFVDLDAAAAQPGRVVFLDLSHDGYETVPSVITQMVVMENLDLHGNRITSIPPSLGHLPRLRHLDLSDNRLEEWPSGLFALRNLHSLDVSGNLLHEIPREITNLLALTSLDLRGNDIVKTNVDLDTMANCCILLDDGALPLGREHGRTGDRGGIGGTSQQVTNQFPDE